MKLKIDQLKNKSGGGYKMVSSPSSILLSTIHQDDFNELEAFLQASGLEQYIPHFSQEGFTDFFQLFDVTDEDLICMGLRLAHRIQFRKALQRYQQNKLNTASHSNTISSPHFSILAKTVKSNTNCLSNDSLPKKYFLHPLATRTIPKVSHLLQNERRDLNDFLPHSPLLKCNITSALTANGLQSLDSSISTKSNTIPSSIIGNVSDTVFRPVTSFVRSRDQNLKSPSFLEPIPCPSCPSLADKSNDAINTGTTTTTTTATSVTSATSATSASTTTISTSENSTPLLTSKYFSINNKDIVPTITSHLSSSSSSSSSLTSSFSSSSLSPSTPTLNLKTTALVTQNSSGAGKSTALFSKPDPDRALHSIPPSNSITSFLSSPTNSSPRFRTKTGNNITLPTAGCTFDFKNISSVAERSSSSPAHHIKNSSSKNPSSRLSFDSAAPISTATTSCLSYPSSSLKPSLLEKMLTSTPSSSSDLRMPYFQSSFPYGSHLFLSPEPCRLNHVSSSFSSSSSLFNNQQHPLSPPFDPFSYPADANSATSFCQKSSAGVYPDYSFPMGGSESNFSSYPSFPVSLNNLPSTSSFYSNYGATLITPHDQPYLQISSASNSEHSKDFSDNSSSNNENSSNSQLLFTPSSSSSPSLGFGNSQTDHPDLNSPTLQSSSSLHASESQLSTTSSPVRPSSDLVPPPETGLASSSFTSSSLARPPNIPVEGQVPTQSLLSSTNRVRATHVRSRRKRGSLRSISSTAPVATPSSAPSLTTSTSSSSTTSSFLSRMTRTAESTASSKRPYRRHPKPDPSEPPKPFSAYMMFSNEVRQELKEHGLSFSKLAKIVGDRWKCMDAAEKQAREDHAAQLKAEYQMKLFEYHQTPQFQHYLNYLHDFEAAAALSGRTFIRARKKFRSN